MPNPRPNPYVGPRSFQTGETLYGRERETLELLDLLIAERIVLLYSPSGAGKTSLIQAALTPKLRAEGFNVLPPMRVSIEPPHLPPPPESKPGAAPLTPPNRFVLSALLSLEERVPQAQRLSLGQLRGMTFDGYLQQRIEANTTAGAPETNPILIFDQFEEILTVDTTNLDAKQAFFDQIGEALRNRGRWALFSMREDYLAGLDPYRRPIPTRFDTTYRLDLLGIAAAREAIQAPARKGGVDFTDPAASKLVNDLRRVQVQRPDGTMETQPGPYVEPVQLQVVCYRLWDQLPESKTAILESDIEDAGDVNSALADYYDAAVKSTAAASGESERTIREWFDRQLITEQGIRGQVIMEPDKSRGLSNRAIRLFEDAHLVRAEERRGATWFELSHDRLIEPIRTSNAAWFKANLSALQQAADLWNRQGRQEGLLLRDAALDDANKWAAAHSAELTPVEHDFLQDSQHARAIEERAKQQNRRIRLLAVGATVLSVLALIAFVIALLQFGSANTQAGIAQAAQATAVFNAQAADNQKANAVSQDRVSRMTSAALAQLNVDPEVSLLLATQAYSLTQNIQTDDALRQAVNESHVRGTLTGHTGGINSVSISPDGKYFITGSDDLTARIWDAATGKTIKELKGHTAPIQGAFFSPDSKHALTTSEDKTARLWDLSTCLTAATDCPFTELKGHGGTVWGGAFSPDGTLVATSSEDMTAKLWDVATGKEVRTLNGHTQGVNSVAFSPDGRSLVTASSDQTARVWDLTVCNPDCPFQELKGQAILWGAVFSPDGKFVVTASDDQNAYKYDLSTDSVVNYLSGHADAVFGVAYSPDGKYIATASRDGTARLWDADSGQLITILRGHQDEVYAVAFSPDSQLLLTGSLDKTAKLWSTNGGIELRVLRGHLNKVFGADYSGDGKRVITVSGDRTARVWDAATGNLVVPPLTGHTNWVNDGALTQDGTRAATASYDNTARVWDLTNCNPDCPSIPITGHTDIVWSVVFNTDGTRLLTASNDHTAKVWDVSGGTVKPTPLLTLHEPTDAIYHATFSPDGKFILTANGDNTAMLWDATGSGDVTTPLLTLRGHSSLVENASFNSDGTLIVTASDDRTARVWDATARGDETTSRLILRGHTAPVTGAAFSSDDQYIVTASADQTARLWDAKTGVEQSVLRGHTDRVQTVEVSPDNRFILTASSDKTARIVLAKIQDVFALAKTRATRALSCEEWQTLLQEANFCPGGGVAQNLGALPTSAPVTRVAFATLPPPTPTATLAPPTLTPTAEAATATPTLAPQATTSSAPVAAATPTVALAPTKPPVTPTPALPPGVYVSKIVYNRLEAPNFQFKVTFINTTGVPIKLYRWTVPFYEAGARNSIGAPKGTTVTIPVGTTELVTEPWKVGVQQCTTYTAQPVSVDPDGGQSRFLQPNGSPSAAEFQHCPY